MCNEDIPSEGLSTEGGQDLTNALVLMPGMDGTGWLFKPFKEVLPPDISAQVVVYPNQQALSYEELLPQIRAQLPKTQDFLLVAESFSGPLAIRLAAENPVKLRGLVLVATFASCPTKFPTWLLLPILRFLPIPTWAIRHFLFGPRVRQEDVRLFRKILAQVSPQVLARRMCEVLRVDVRPELASVSVPILLLAGGKDKLISQKALKEIQSIARAPITTRVLPQAPHFLLQVEAQASWEALNEWQQLF